TLGNGTTGAQIHNLVAGTTATDAVNLGQLTAAGLNVDTSGHVTNSFVAYNDSTKGTVTLGGTAGTTLSNVKAGVANMDAVNVAQLTAAGLAIDTSGHVTNSFVAYDNASKSGVTLGNGTTGAQIHNLVAGTTATDAVNLGQLTAAGLNVDTSGHVTNSFVAYNDSTKGTVTLGGTAGTTLSNVKAGVANMDAVNVAQLTAAGLAIDTSGHVTNSFVAYDNSSKSGVTLGNGTTGAQIHNLVAGTTGTDAVNLQQLTDAGITVDTSGHVTNSFVAYDDSSKGTVTFGGGSAGTRLTNVAAGFGNTDAVNVSQLTPVVAGLGGGATIDPKTGVVTGPTYNIQGNTYNNAGDAFKNVDTSLTKLGDQISSLPGGIGLVAQDATTGNITVGALTGGTVVDMTNSSGVARTVTGVAAGNVSQSSVDAINGGQLYGVSSSFATAIGGGAAVNPDGTITQPSFTVGGKTVYNVGDAISNLDTNETNNYSNLQTQITNIAAGGTANAVAYDTSAHDKITLGGTAATATTLLTNLTAGDISSADSTDAVTGGQLYTTNQNVAALQTSVQNIGSTGTTGIAMNGADGKPGSAGPAGATGADAIAMGDSASASGDHAIVIGGGASGTGDGTIAIGGNSSANGKDSIAIGNGATAPADNAVALGANSVADRDNSVSVGSPGNERQITNVAPGTQGTDAVNLNQMNSAVGGIARKAYSGIAAATALTMIPDVDANKTLSIGIGGGTFQGYAATAIGGTARITQNIKLGTHHTTNQVYNRG
ncbi:YadA family autotransporter adhesin, partial [Caballeronia sordidicola]|uniref:YadA family autotransporter adhesin n=1 Tax=Caballeronia sordidicola TaxID=196367 RepID=UPI0015C64A2A